MATRSNSKVIEFIKRMYYPIRNAQFIYVNLINLESLVSWRKRRSEYAEIIDRNSRILRDLNENGIAFANIESLLLNSRLFAQMEKWINSNEVNLVQKDKKRFLLSYFGRTHAKITLDTTNPFFDFYLSDSIIAICSEYLGYIPQLNYLSIEKTIPINEGLPPTHSQNWHRDPEEKRTLKVFIYVNDVDDNNGPFIYIKGSQATGKSKYSRVFPQTLPYGSYPSDVEIDSLVNQKDMITAVGKKGTVIFCDTSGLHRGGLATKGERIMSTGFYPSKKWTESPGVIIERKTDLAEYGMLAKELLI